VKRTVTKSQEEFLDFFLDVLATAERMHRNPHEHRLAWHDSIELSYFRKAHWFSENAVDSGALHWASE
jgi:hypothetical protein